MHNVTPSRHSSRHPKHFLSAFRCVFMECMEAKNAIKTPQAQEMPPLVCTLFVSYLGVDSISYGGHGHTDAAAQSSDLGGEDLGRGELADGDHTQGVTDEHGDDGQEGNHPYLVLELGVETTVRGVHVEEGGDGGGGEEDDGGGEHKEVPSVGVPDHHHDKEKEVELSPLT